jgi:hypothetical protein
MWTLQRMDLYVVKRAMWKNAPAKGAQMPAARRWIGQRFLVGSCINRVLTAVQWWWLSEFEQWQLTGTFDG